MAMKVYPEPALEMLILRQPEDGFVRISLTTSWDRGVKCDVCGEEIEVSTVWMEHLEGGCHSSPCSHPDEDGDCSLMRHDKIHFRHLSPSFSCLPEEAQARARVHWKGCI